MVYALGYLAAIIGFTYICSVFSEAWQRIEEYENMKRRGYTLMQDDKGDDFWVGYGD
jgi:hypothetical protein